MDGNIVVSIQDGIPPISTHIIELCRYLYALPSTSYSLEHH